MAKAGPASAGAAGGRPRGSRQKSVSRLVRGKVGKRSQRDLESAILRRAAAGRDCLDRRRALDVKIVPVLLGSTGVKEMPRAWTRFEDDGQKVARGAAEWYVPPRADPQRRMLFLHGGSYVTWAPQDLPYRSLGTRLAAASGTCVFAVDYRMAPEFLFPAAFEDCVAALAWVASHGPDSPLEVSQATDVFVCGDSAGGGLAVAVSMRTPPAVRRVLRGVIGISPWMDLTASTPSYDTRKWDAAHCFGDAVNAGVTRASGQEEAEGYLGRGGVKRHGRDWRASPFFAPAPLLRTLPPILFHVGDYEVILDESVLLGERMKKAGLRDVTVCIYPRMWHVWHQYSEGGGERQELTKAVRAVREIGRWVKARCS